jgi:hypothetical protein
LRPRGSHNESLWACGIHTHFIHIISIGYQNIPVNLDLDEAQRQIAGYITCLKDLLKT